MSFPRDILALGLSGLPFEFTLLFLDPAQPSHNRNPDGVFADCWRGSYPDATGWGVHADMQVLDRFADQFHRQPGREMGCA
jgi:hypothetical protein